MKLLAAYKMVRKLQKGEIDTVPIHTAMIVNNLESINDVPENIRDRVEKNLCELGMNVNN